MKKSIFFIIFLTLLPIAVFAHGEENFDEAKQLAESNISCDNLNENQLELIGDYIMEQVHPGEEHDAMEEAMGGESSESLRDMHISMARRMYCSKNNIVSQQGMMGMQNMMSQNPMQMSMMSNNIIPTTNSFLSWILGLIGFVILIGLAFLVWILVIKFWKEIRKKK